MEAKQDFEDGVREVRVLLEVSEMKPRGLEPEDAIMSRANAARRASVVLLTAHFESYLKSTAEEFVDYVSTGTVQSRAMPADLRDLQTMHLINSIHRSASLTERTAHFKKLSQVAQLWNAEAKPSPGSLSTEVLSRQVTSAKPDKINRLFQLMGGTTQVCDGDIDVVLPSMGPNTLNIRHGLMDVVGCRDAIAHGDSTRKPTSQDVERYIALLKALVDRLDRKARELKTGVLPTDFTDPSTIA